MSLDAELKETVRDAVREVLREQSLVPRKALTIAEAAQSLGRSERYVRRLVDNGELHARRGGPNGHLMIPCAAIDAWLMDGAA